MPTFKITVTNECPTPRFDGKAVPFAKTFGTREKAEREAAKWTAHIASFNRVMCQNVRYDVVEVV